jgi:hypothetical protein
MLCLAKIKGGRKSTPLFYAIVKVLTILVLCIKLSKQYIVEIHECETPLIDNMLQAGYNSKLILKLNEWVKIYFFTRPAS